MTFRIFTIGFLSLLLWLAPFRLGAQLSAFKHYSVKDGISQSEIKCIFQDSEGFLWLGTQNGLNKFNGYTFDKYFYNPSDSNSISNNWIFGITEDGEGNLWIATKEGVNKFEKTSGQFTRINHLLSESPVEDNFVYGITSDETNIYMNAPPVLAIYNYKTGELTNHLNSFSYEGILDDFGYPVIKSKNGLIWTGSRQGLGCFDPEKDQFTLYTQSNNPRSIISNHITALFEDQNGDILIGTANGADIFDSASRRIRRLVNSKTPGAPLSHDFVRSITTDHAGFIWIGTDEGGLNKVFPGNPHQRPTIQHFRYSGTSGTISHDIVYSLYEDRSNNLWIGTIAGLDKLDLKEQKFKHYKKTDNEASIDLLDNVIGAIYKNKDDKLWIGTWNKGLNIYDRKKNRVTHYSSSQKGIYYLPDNNIHVIFRDKKDRIWLGTRNGIYLYHPLTKSFITFSEHFNIDPTDYFEGNRVYCMLEDSFGKIWIGTANGIFIFNPQSLQTTIIQSALDDSLQICSNLVYSLIEDKDHHIWIATSGGLNQYNPFENKMYQHQRQPGSENTLYDNYAISLCEDIRQNIWIGTSSGVCRFNKPDSVFSYYNIDDGLPSNIIYDILEDNNHNLWFTTGNGLAQYDLLNDQIKSFTREEGVQGMEFNIKAAFKGDDGELFLGGMDGFISFFPDSLSNNRYIPPVKITSFEKENNGKRSKINTYPGTIKLSHHDYSFTIEFSALDYSDPSKNLYTYQLWPVSDQWININNQHFVHFTNLPSGKYIFRVKGSNSDGVWNKSATSLAIHISPPWWKSFYAFLLYVIITMVTILFFIKNREQNLLNEKKILEAKIQERTQEILKQKNMLDVMNSTKDKFFSILAHDLKGPFSSLYSLSETLDTNYRHLDEDDRQNGIKKIRKVGEAIFKLLENLLTWSRLQQGRLEFTPVKFNLSDLIQTNINLNKIIAAEKEITLTANTPKKLMAFGDMEMINTVLRNLINNAIKFSPQGKTIKVAVKKQNEHFEISVKDQGVGISAENRQRLFRIDVKYKTLGTAGETGTGLGLVLCHEFVEKNGGTIWCESRENAGTTFHFTLPMFKEVLKNQ